LRAIRNFQKMVPHASSGMVAIATIAGTDEKAATSAIRDCWHDFHRLISFLPTDLLGELRPADSGFFCL
jgi:hypothetical protein